MQFSALITSVLCLVAAQFAAAEDLTSMSTTTITKTLLRVNSVTPTPTPSSSMMSVTATSTPLVVSSTHAAPSATHTGGAVSMGAGVPAALIAGSFALIMGQAL
ncbi:hypothetical protein N7448_006488 [Penicillium atrosanguineum]|uniref:Uncharacterized protein n=1 Tax=Penicillium atrosanguineum TaxID=1132637 RepID=A0A9W9U236_9EURO|nr:uncharacterized protein N7443_010250 [Penicillium atrosanguineum]KAJ5132330.1 hypothetical protein N7448_006488 [Penicillium atrosanguineum]KAJ5137457.1 hypothetical protein N7526_003690 [Penicillium atrosanguineum]KAJ5289997.1 hypothetical protein N7443_010250 [Penicillium atrosanguineum]KAJ5307819.1 hypothetical protein N7476_008475 [Penicillium atrosanguineum]